MIKLVISCTHCHLGHEGLATPRHRPIHDFFIHNTGEPGQRTAGWMAGRRAWMMEQVGTFEKGVKRFADLEAGAVISTLPF